MLKKVLAVEICIYSQYGRENLDLLKQGPYQESLGNDDVSVVHSRK